MGVIVRDSGDNVRSEVNEKWEVITGKIQIKKFSWDDGFRKKFRRKYRSLIYLGTILENFFFST